MQGKVYRYTGAMADSLSLWHSLNLLSDTWWFGWSETEMHLPQRLNGNIPQADWERLSIFNGEAEVRYAQCGDKNIILLLTETVEPRGEWKLCEQYSYCKPSQHILLGDPPEGDEGETLDLVNVAFPRIFNYGIPVMHSKSNRHHVVIGTIYYYDSAYRLRYVRSKDLSLQTWEVK